MDYCQYRDLLQGVATLIIIVMLYDVRLDGESGNRTQKVLTQYILMRVGMEQERNKVKLRQSNQREWHEERQVARV